MAERCSWLAPLLRLWLLCGALAVAGAPALAVQVRDDRGVVVELDQVPRRIVSLLPSLTETVCALGHCQRLVGVDRYSNWPKAIRPLPRVGGGLDPQIETIVALRPDLVLAATSARAALRLEALGIKVLALEPKQHADVQRSLAVLGEVLQVPDPQRAWRDIAAGLQAVSAGLPPEVRGLRVYVEVNDGPYGASASSFIGETLQRMGVGNILPGTLGPFPKINPELVVRADPDVILLGERGVATAAQRPGWAGLRALRNGRVCAFTPEQGDVLVRAGPRMVEAARLMADCLTGRWKGQP